MKNVEFWKTLDGRYFIRVGSDEKPIFIGDDESGITSNIDELLEILHEHDLIKYDGIFIANEV